MRSIPSPPISLSNDEEFEVSSLTWSTQTVGDFASPISRSIVSWVLVTVITFCKCGDGRGRLKEEYLIFFAGVICCTVPS